MRHDSIRDLWASLCKKAYRHVVIEPTLAPVPSTTKFKLNSTTRDSGARSDVMVRGFYSNNLQSNHFDVTVFAAHAPSNTAPNCPTVKAAFKKHGDKKRRKYVERIIQVDQGSFTPLVMSSSGGMGKEMEVALSRLANKIADSKHEAYSHVITNLRLRFAFVIARSALVMLHGERREYVNGCDLMILEADSGLVVSESSSA